MSNMSLDERTKNYADEIVKIEDFIERVRQTPDVFIGKVHGNIAFLTMVREIFQNAIDEIMKGVAYSPNVYVFYDENTHQVTVEDNGRGIPHGKIGQIFGESHSSSNYNKQPGVFSAGKNGCGGSTTNALSHKFIVESYVLGEGRKAEFIEGHITKKGEVKIPCKGKQGSTITFFASEDCIGEITATWKDVSDLIAIITPSTPIGTHVEFSAIDKNNKKIAMSFDNKNGIATYVNSMTQTGMLKVPVYCEANNGEMKCQVMFTYDATNMEESIISLNNTCPTEGGTHVDGAIDGIVKFFRNYMNKIYLNSSAASKGKKKSKKQLTCTAADVRTGLKLAVVTFHLHALYNGQAKEILDNDEMTPFVSDTVQGGLDTWSKQNPSDLQKLCKFFKEIIEMRTKTDDAKVKLSTKFQPSLLSGGLPAKYVKPNGRKGIEFVIVEGDSALGSTRNSRDNQRQGIFPIRGKLPNAFVKSKQAMLSNEEVASILTICEKTPDLEKIIIMPDADPDGAHIRSLVIKLFCIYARKYIEQGKVYSAIPPLYAIPMGKNKYKYFATKVDFIKYIQNEFSVKNKITRKSKALSKSDITRILLNFSNYVDDVNRVADTYAINPYVLEDILWNMNKSEKLFTKAIKSKYRFADIKKINGILVIEGVMYETYHTIYLNDMLKRDIAQNLAGYTNKESVKDQLYLNGKPVSMYELMSEFGRFMPPKLARFKGLGEMDPMMLAESTLLPGSDRHLIKYTFEDLDKEIMEMRNLNSNKDMLLD